MHQRDRQKQKLGRPSQRNRRKASQEGKKNKNENQSCVGARSALLHAANGGRGQGSVSQGKGGGVYRREAGRHFVASCAPAEEGKRKENVCGIWIFGPGGG